MMDVKYQCNEILTLFRGDAVETLKSLEFYIRNLEQFIERERSQEISDLKRHADHLPEDRQGEFWAWHYPVHWDEIFANQLRSSFVVTLVSLAESHVGMVAKQACEIVGAPLKLGDLRGGILERHRKCLEALAGFKRPDKCSWTAIDEIYAVRNCIVHANSQILEGKNEARLRSLVGKLPGLTAAHDVDVLELSEEFPTHAFQTVQEFLLDLYEEAKELCRRAVD